MDEHRTSYRGTVVSISERMWEPDKGSFSVEVKDVNQPKPKKAKPGESVAVPSDYPRTQTHTVSAEMAKNLRIGDRVVCETVIRKVRDLKRKGNPGSKDEGY